MQNDAGLDEYTHIDFESLYRVFDAPINDLDCGKKCAPYNTLGVPFCCDIQQIIPTAYLAEWSYLKDNTNLWDLWSDEDAQKTEKIAEEIPSGQVPIVCLGADQCQRNYRALTCRAFPFFPYLTSHGEFIGLSYYWEYEDRCWVISNLQVVDTRYILQFTTAFEALLIYFPEEILNFQSHSDRMRRTFEKENRSIPLLHQDGQSYIINPNSERMQQINIKVSPKFGPYQIAAQMPFPDEIQNN